MKKVLFVYRTKRQPVLDNWLKGKEPDSKLFGLNHLRKMGYQVDFFDTAYSKFNPLHWICYPFEHMILDQIGMGFKLDQALTLLPKVNNYDVIVATGDSSGLPFAWLKYLGLIKKPLIYMSSGLVGALRAHPKSWVVKFYKKIFKSTDLITCYAEVEREYFIKAKYIPYGTDWQWWSKKSKQTRSVIVAAGIDLTRDYKTFFEAVKNLDVKVEIACHPNNLKGLTVPDNVKVSFLVDYLTMRKMFQRAKLVVVPLREAGRSAGQMVALEAASARAPLIVSKVRGMTEAFDWKNKRGLIYVPPENPRAMKLAIRKVLDRPKTAQVMAKKVSNYVKKNYTSEHLARNIATFIKNMLNSKEYGR